VTLEAGYYARFELERRFLLERLPDGLDEGSLLVDHYVTGTRLRLRRVEGPEPQYKLSQKEAPSPPDYATMTITTLYLSRAEYDTLSVLPGKELRKRRYRLDPYSIDVFEAASHLSPEAGAGLYAWALRAGQPNDPEARRRALEAAAAAEDVGELAIEKFALDVGAGERATAATGPAHPTGGGGAEAEADGHGLVPSPRDVPTDGHKPAMSAPEAAQAFVDAWREEPPRFGIINFANADMVGHTGGSPAAVAHWIGLVALIILVAGSLVTLMGVAPRPGPPPFLVDGEAMIVGVGVSRYLPATFALS